MECIFYFLNKILNGVLSFLNPSWPQAVMLLSLIVIYKFGQNIAQLFNRVKEVSQRGLIFAEQNAPPETVTEIKDRVEKFFDSVPTITSNEEILKRNLENLDSGQKINRLTQELSTLIFILRCESNYYVIFGSQIQLLKMLNTAPQPLTYTETKSIF